MWWAVGPRAVVRANEIYNDVPRLLQEMTEMSGTEVITVDICDTEAVIKSVEQVRACPGCVNTTVLELKRTTFVLRASSGERAGAVFRVGVQPQQLRT
jgi:hypothetical protein